MRGDWAGESSRCEDPAPTVGRLRGCHCVAHCDPNAVITTASLRMPCHPGSLTFFITMRRGRGGHSRAGGCAATAQSASLTL